MDPAERDLLQRNLKLAEDNNRLLHQMRRSQRWGTFFRIFWWLLIFGVSGVAYYYYFWPYMQQLLALYQNAQQGGAQAQDFMQQFSSFFANWTHSTTTPQ